MSAANGPMGGLIRDHYSYNQADIRADNPGAPEFSMISLAAHWVGDLAIECDVDVKSSLGTVMLDLVEGGAHFTIAIELKSGRATVRCTDPNVRFVDDERQTLDAPSAETRMKGSGKYHVMMANADDRIFLWINNRPVNFGSHPYLDYERSGAVLPKYSDRDPGDSEALGVGSRGASMTVTNLKVWRDVYYTSVGTLNPITGRTYGDQSGPSEYGISIPYPRLQAILENPRLWDSDLAQDLFASRKRTENDVRPLEENQFFPMGDNSPDSSDARIWNGPEFVDREMLIGRALFIYWPHTHNKPFRFFPNFGRMKFIR